MFDIKINVWSMYKYNTKKMKRQPTQWKRYSQYIYPTNDLYLEHIKNSYKSA